MSIQDIHFQFDMERMGVKREKKIKREQKREMQMHIHAKSRYLFSHVIQKMYNCSIECYFFSS